MFVFNKIMADEKKIEYYSLSEAYDYFQSRSERPRSDQSQIHPDHQKNLNIPLLDSELSYQQQFLNWQSKALKLLVLVVSVGVMFQPYITVIFLCSVFYLVFLICIFWRLILTGVGLDINESQTRFSAKFLVPETLPIYSILVPAYREANMMDQLAAALRALDWPQDRLDIQILLEEEDEDTWRAAQKADFPIRTRVQRVPSGVPRTKPRALNYGLARAEGRYVCVYDVEDRPHPDQLRQAYLTFQCEPGKLACVQAPLIGTNTKEAWIAAQWSLEYAVQFGLLLPALAAMGLPISLGGTSNHFRRDILIAVGGWDAWNVTEDADIGLRFARGGLKVGMIDAPTYEDAPTDFSIWFAQRSRWIKGFIQTWMVLMRRPGQTLSQMGLVNFLSVQIGLGGAILAPLLHGPLFILIMMAIVSNTLTLGTIGWSLLLLGGYVSMLGDAFAPGPWSRQRVIAVLTRPLYWPLHSIAAFRAVWELAVAPHFWAKTPHTPRSEKTSFA